MATAQRRVEILIGAALHPSFLKSFKALDDAAKRAVGAFKAVNSGMAKMAKQGQMTESVMRKLGVTLGNNLRRVSKLSDAERQATAARVKHMRAEVRAMDGLRQMQRNLAAATMKADRAQTMFNRSRRDSSRIRPPRLDTGGGFGATGNGASNARPPRGGDAHANFGKGLMQAGGWTTGAGIATALPLGLAVADFAGLEGELQGVLNTAGVGEETRGNVMKQLLGMTARDKTNKGAPDLLSGLNVFASAGGLDFADQMANTQLSGRVATATRGLTEDMAKTGVALMKNMMVPSGQLEDVFGKLVVAGKMGAFELKDMAAYFPTVGAMAANLGLTGERGVASVAAAMQAVRKNTGTSGEAATNIENLFGKMMSTDLLSNLKDAGIDWGAQVEEILANNKAGGSRNMLEEFVQVMQTATGGSPIKMKELLPDMQAGNALLALIQHQGGADGYTATRDAAMRGGKADIDTDFAKNTRTAEAAMNAFSNSFQRMKMAVGAALVPAFTAFSKVADKVSAWADASPGLVNGLSMVAAGVAGIGLVLGPVLIGLGGMVWAGGQLATLFAAGGVLAGAAGALKAAFVAVALAPMAALGPVLAVVAGVVAIGALVYKYWEPLSALLMGAFEGIWDALLPVRELVSEVAGIFGGIVDWVKELFTPVETTTAQFSVLAEIGRGLGKVIAFVVLKPLNMMATAVSMIGHLFKWLWNAGVATFEGIGNLIGKWLGPENVAALSGVWTGFVDGIGKVFTWTWDNVIKPLVDWLGGAIDAVFARIDSAKKFLGGSKSYDEARQKMINAGAWKDDTGDDSLDMAKARNMVATGQLLPADIGIIQSDMYAGKMGEKLDQEYFDSLNVLKREAEARAAAPATGGNTVTIENKPVTHVNIVAPDPPAAGRAVKQALSELHSSDLHRLSDGAYDKPGGR